MSTDRRDFVITGAGSLLALAGAPALVRQQGTYDLVIRNGTVFDGTPAAGIEADVAISGDRIAQVAPRIAGRGTNEIDARGLAVSPGFVDLHSHGDGSMDEDPRQESLIRQGITTIVVGQDGSSRAGGNGQGAAEGMGGVLASVDALKPAVNVASMIGLGSVRGRVVGNVDRPATPDELRTMVGMVESALRDGACGASSGLEYTPGAFASTAELIELCKPLAARRLPYATH